VLRRSQNLRCEKGEGYPADFRVAGYPSPFLVCASARTMIIGTLASLDREHDLALNVSAIGPFVGPASFGKRKGAVDRNADRPVVKQAPDFLQLRTTRSDLR
jgi:hypothetical protein